MKVRLTWPEVSYGAKIGVDRQLANVRQGNHDGHRFKGDPFDIHIQGSLAELAWAKAHKKYWEPFVSDPKTLPGDVGHVQIRSTTRRNGCLIVHESDPDTAPFYLVVADLPDFTIAGWVYGHEAKDRRFWRTDTGRPAFFVPQEHLRPPVAAESAAA